MLLRFIQLSCLGSVAGLRRGSPCLAKPWAAGASPNETAGLRLHSDEEGPNPGLRSRTNDLISFVLHDNPAISEESTTHA
jgi:hypothetical protein